MYSFGQSYEGTLTYVSDIDVTEKLIKMGMSKQNLLNKMKADGSWSDTIMTYYKQGNYYTLLNNYPRSWAIYRADSNQVYSMQDGDASDICNVTDASIDLEFTMTSKMPTVQKLDTVAIVNGISCNIVRVKWKSGTYDYYYNPTYFTINASLFERHLLDGWAEFLKISNALPIKIVKSINGMMSVSFTLISNKSESINDKLFLIPQLLYDENLNIVKVTNKKIMRIKK
jgi:hypothetical protein